MNELPSGWNLPPGVFEHMIPGNRPGDDEPDLQAEWNERWGEIVELFVDDGISVDDALDIVGQALAAREAKA